MELDTIGLVLGSELLAAVHERTITHFHDVGLVQSTDSRARSSMLIQTRSGIRVEKRRA